jgi:1-deoxy-D-xylulose 5-phosphate reductoisomerase
VLNAADEVAVQAVLDRRIAFPVIYDVNARVLERRLGLDGSVERLLQADARARRLAQSAVDALVRERGAR